MAQPKSDGAGVIDCADVDRRVSGRAGAIAELTTVVKPPTTQSARVEQSAAMPTAKSRGAGVINFADPNRPRALRCGPVAELTCRVIPPTKHRSGFEQRAAMVKPKSDRGEFETANC